MHRSPKFGSCPRTRPHKLVLADRKLKLREIADELKISEGSPFTILNQHLSMRKLCLLTVNQIQERVDDSVYYLRNKDDFFRKYGTMNETRIHHFPPESNWQSDE